MWSVCLGTESVPPIHDDVIMWKNFPRYWSFEGMPPVTCGFRSQGPVTRSIDDFFISSWTNGWANRRYVGDLMRHRAHDDVAAMITYFEKYSFRSQSKEINTFTSPWIRHIFTLADSFDQPNSESTYWLSILNRTTGDDVLLALWWEESTGHRWIPQGRARNSGSCCWTNSRVAVDLGHWDTILTL